MATRVIRPVSVKPKKGEEQKNDNLEDSILNTTFDQLQEGERDEQEGQRDKSDVTEEKKPKTKEEIRKENEMLWGRGFKDEEYEVLNSKLEQFRKHYPMRTAMHQEALITYLKYAQRRDKAIEEGDSDDAETWGKLATKQAQDAKINPSQLSLADLSNGISNVGKIVEAVEKSSDIIPILPQFVRQPRDEVDYVIWQFINYNQRMVNMQNRHTKKYILL